MEPEPGFEISLIWQLRVVSALCLVVPLPVKLWLSRIPDLAPSFIPTVTQKFAELNGLHFALKVEPFGPCARMSLYYQNRYDQACFAKISLTQTRGFFWSENDKPQIDFIISAAGGEYGKQSLIWPIPPKLRGKAASWQATGTNKYPSGRGTLLIGQNGMIVAKSDMGVTERTVWFDTVMAAGGDTVNEQPSELVTERIWKLGDPVVHNSKLR